MTGSDCFVEFPELLRDQDESDYDQPVEVTDININMQLPIDTSGFGNKDADGYFGHDSLNVDSSNKKNKFYETAKFNPRSLAELGDQTISSCNEAEEEAHLPEIKFFNQSSRMRFRSIQQMDE